MPEVIRRGPLFDGQAEVAVAAFADRAVREVARVGQDDIGIQLIKVLQHPTGFYESNIRNDLTGVHTRVINDNNVIYGPWLEGTSSRNQTTRFKGYATFRLMTQQLDRKVPEIVAPMIPELIADLSI